MNPNNSSSFPRVLWLDAARGGAIVAMIVYHFGFDLSWFGLIPLDFYTTPWLRVTRTLIVTAFLFIAGMSLALAARQPQSLPRFWKRIAILAGCAALVSLASWLVFPETWIYFGVLHCIAVASLLTRPVLHDPKLARRLGMLIVLAGVFFHHPMFNPPELSWIGFVSELPRTEDYVPLFPWLGVVLLGAGVQGMWLAAGTKDQAPPPPPPQPASRWQTGLRWLGRHSLFIYMVHQPILAGVVYMMAVWGGNSLVY